MDELTDTDSTILFVHYEQLLCVVISDTVHCFKTTNVVELLGTVEKCALAVVRRSQKFSPRCRLLSRGRRMAKI